jgi:hypothetical protein
MLVVTGDAAFFDFLGSGAESFVALGGLSRKGAAEEGAAAAGRWFPEPVDEVFALREDGKRSKPVQAQSLSGARPDELFGPSVLDCSDGQAVDVAESSAGKSVSAS